MSNIHKVSVSWRIVPAYDEHEYSFTMHTQCCGSWRQVRVRESRKTSIFDAFKDELRVRCPTCGKGAVISRDDAIRMAMRVRGTGDMVERHITEEVASGQDPLQVEAD